MLLFFEIVTACGSSWWFLTLLHARRFFFSYVLFDERQFVDSLLGYALLGRLQICRPVFSVWSERPSTFCFICKLTITLNKWKEPMQWWLWVAWRLNWPMGHVWFSTYAVSPLCYESPVELPYNLVSLTHLHVAYTLIFSIFWRSTVHTFDCCREFHWSLAVPHCYWDIKRVLGRFPRWLICKMTL